MFFDYLFWVLSHFHRRENKSWSIFSTCSAFSIYIFTYLFLIIHIGGVLLKDNLFLKIEKIIPNDELLIFGIFVGLTLILYQIYSKRIYFIEQKVKQRVPSYKDYLKVLCILIVPLILIYSIR